ncbi:hypothetical protein [Myceligenerans indicum]|uniref:Uncharacterized protein n=1 Tax=Myceligenerans indicum TaxID=2593663 RepID=A0ABS1LR43_9MICO|nr:hypothetical protein [Myceligenerans indicum]MBL0888474.1 hypothetical protein [Myceligenerans indicum]
MSPKLRLVLIWLAVIAVVSMIISDPNGSADFVLTIWDMIWGAVLAIATFFEELFTGILAG